MYYWRVSCATRMESEWYGVYRSSREVVNGYRRFIFMVYLWLWLLWIFVEIIMNIVFLRRVSNRVWSKVSIFSWSYYSIEVLSFVTGWNLCMLGSLSIVPESREWYFRTCIVWYTSQTAVPYIQCTSEMATRAFHWRGTMVGGRGKAVIAVTVPEIQRPPCFSLGGESGGTWPGELVRQGKRSAIHWGVLSSTVVTKFIDFAGISCVYLPSTCTRCRNREGSILFFELDGWLESYSELTRWTITRSYSIDWFATDGWILFVAGME